MRTVAWAPAGLGRPDAEPWASVASANSAPPESNEARFARAEGLELLGALQGSGYRAGTSLVRRPDGRMVQLSPLLYRLLACLDRPMTATEVAGALSEATGRRVAPDQAEALAGKLAHQGLLAGTEDAAPPPPNPLMALRWKVLVTRPRLTSLLTTPFTFLFRPWIMWPAIGAFGAVFWFVLIHKGVASATAQAFNDPGLLVLVFVLGVASAGFHELGHAAACRYGGAEPRGFGMGLYLVWPCFYTDVTDAYRLSRRARLRVDLAGLYFNALVAVGTMVIWLTWRKDALLLLVALQLLQMVKQLSPVIRADGYHILSDATGVPDLYAHMGSTLRSLMPGGHRRSGVLHGWTRLFVTIWVLVMIPVLASLMLGAVLLLPRLLSSAWTSGRRLVDLIPHHVAAGQSLQVCADLVELLAIVLPVIGTVLMTQKFVRTYAGKARSWSAGRPNRRLLVTLMAVGLAVGLTYAWWPSGQYQPVRADQKGTLLSLAPTLEHPQSALRPVASERVNLRPGTYLAMALIPEGGASAQHPALFVLPGKKGHPPVMLMSTSALGGPTEANSAGSSAAAPPEPPESGAVGTFGPDPTSTRSTTSATPDPSSASPSPPSAAAGGYSPTSAVSSAPVTAAAFPFKLPSRPSRGDSQALALGTQTGGVAYNIAYSVVTISGGRPVTNRNSAYALASCQSCTTVAVSFQVVLVVGQSKTIMPINTAEALNSQCPACATTAIADQIVVSLKSRPSKQLIDQIDASLQSLNALPVLGSGGTPQAVAAQVSAIQDQIDSELSASGALAAPLTSPSSSTSTTTGSGTTTTSPQSAAGATPDATTSSTAVSSTGSSPASTTTTSTGSGSSTTSSTSSSTTTSTSSSTSSTTSSSTSTTTTTASSSG